MTRTSFISWGLLFLLYFKHFPPSFCCPSRITQL